MIHSVPALRGTAALILAGCLAAAQAQELEQAMQTAQQRDQAARQTQQEIDRVVARTDDLAEEYLTASKEVDGLNIYNRLLERQIEDQQRELDELSGSMREVTRTERQVMPLMLRMIDALERFVELDLPFLPAARRDRVERLRDMMERADVSVAEKMRQVLQAYQTENEYGRTIEAFKGSLKLEGEERQVDFLRVGRIGLYFQTEDQERTGRWNHEAGEWTSLGAGERRHVRDGLRIARKQIAPDLLMLPVPAPGEGER